MPPEKTSASKTIASPESTQPQVNSVLPAKNTILHQLAGEYRYEDLVAHFDDCKMYLESRNAAGDTPLLYAAKRGVAKSVSFLIKHGASLDCTDNNKFGLIHALAQSGDVATLSRLLETEKHTKKKSRKNTININALTSPSWAPIHGDQRFVCRKWSPIHFALHFNQREMVHFLKARGAKISVDIKNHIRKHDVISKTVPGQIKADAKGVWHAAKSRNLKLLEKLIDQGAPFLERDSKGNTILHDALLAAPPMPRLVLKNALPANGVPKKNNIYIGKEGCTLSYTLMTHLGCVVSEVLPFDVDEKEALTDEKLAELTLQILMHIPVHFCFSTDERYCCDLALMLLKKQEEIRRGYHQDHEALSWFQKQWDDLTHSGQNAPANLFNANRSNKSIIEIALVKGYSRFAYQCVSHLKSHCQTEKKTPDSFIEEYRSIYGSVREQVSKVIDRAIEQKDWYLLAHCINANFESLVVRDSPREAPIHTAFDKRNDLFVEKMILAWHKTLRFEKPERRDEMRIKFINYVHQSKNGYGETLAERRAELKLKDSLEGGAKILHQAKHATKQVWNHVKWQQDYNANHLRQTYSYKMVSAAKTAVTMLPNLASEGLTRSLMNVGMNFTAPYALNAINGSSTDEESWLRWTARNGAYSLAHYTFYGATVNAQIASSVCGYIGGSLARYALPEHLELQGACLGLSEVIGTYAAWQGPLEPKIPSFYFERMRLEECPEFIPATLETFNSIDYYAKQVLSVPANPIYAAVHGIEDVSQAALESLSQLPLVGPVINTGQWLKGGADQTREYCLDQVEWFLLDSVMPETYMNVDRRAFLAQREADRLKTYVEELRQQETLNEEQGLVDESLADKLEEASSESQKAQEFAEALYHETPSYKAFTKFQEDFNDYQQSQIDYEVACRTNSADPSAQQQAINETKEKQTSAYNRMMQSRADLKYFATEEALKALDEETGKIDQETKEGIQNILDDSSLAPWIDNLIANACSQSADKQVIAQIVADEVVKHLFPFGGDAAEMAAKHKEIVDKIVTDDMRGWEREGKKADKAKERAKDNMYQTILANLTGGDIKPRHEASRWDRVGTYVWGGAALLAAGAAACLGQPYFATAMLANGITLLQNKKNGESIPIFSVNMNWDEGGYHRGNFEASIGGGPVYNSAPTSSSTLQLGTRAPLSESLIPQADPFLSNKMVSDVFLPQESSFSFPVSQKNDEFVVPLRKSEEFMPPTDFRKAWDVETYIDSEALTKIANSDSAHYSKDSEAQGPNLAPSEVEPVQQTERKHFKLRHVCDGPKTGNAFIDGVDSFNRGVETARDATVDALLHPFETAKDLAVLGFDLANLVADKTLGITTEDSKTRNGARKEAIVEMAKQFKEGDANTKIEMATTLGAGMILGGGAGKAGATLGKTAAKKTAAVTRAAQKSQNLASKTTQGPSPTAPGIKPSKQSTIPKVEPKLSAPKVKHRYPLRSMAAAGGANALSSTRIISGAAKLAQKAAPVASRKPISRSVKASAPKQSVIHGAPKPLLTQYNLRSRGLHKNVAHKTVKANVELKGLAKTAAVGLNEVTKASKFSGASNGASLSKKVLTAPKTSTSLAKKSVKPASYTPGFEGGKLRSGYGKTAIKYIFSSESQLLRHFRDHGGEFKGAYKTPIEYLAGANDVIKYGEKVKYMYQGAERVGYVKFKSNARASSLSDMLKNKTKAELGVGKNHRPHEASFEFVAINNYGKIATYHVKNRRELFNLLNGCKHINEIRVELK